MATKVYTSNEFKRERDNFTSLCKVGLKYTYLQNKDKKYNYMKLEVWFLKPWNQWYEIQFCEIFTHLQNLERADTKKWLNEVMEVLFR